MYKEENLLLMLNYDTNQRKVLNLYERCRVHQLIVSLNFSKPIKINERLKAKLIYLSQRIKSEGYVYKKQMYYVPRNSEEIKLKTI